MAKITLRRVERRLAEAGFAEVYPEAAADVPDLVPRDAPPIRVQVGDQLRVKRVSKQRFTQSPPRWGEAALVKQLERRGIGRLSAYADIIDTLIERNYVRREGHALVATEPGGVRFFGRAIRGRVRPGVHGANGKPPGRDRVRAAQVDRGNGRVLVAAFGCLASHPIAIEKGDSEWPNPARHLC